MSKIDAAIAIVSYRCANLTIDCLRSIEAERSAPGISIRAVVVDNASGDAPAIERAITDHGWASWATVIVSPRNGGYAYGNNRAFERAYRDGPPDYVHVLNPDTRVRKGAISSLVNFLEAHPDAGIAGGGYENPDGSEWSFAFRFPSIPSELERGLQTGLATRLLQPWVVARQMGDKAEPVDWVGGGSFMIRRELLETIGGLDENYFLYFEETDFCFRAKRAGFSTWYVPESRVMHIGGQSTGVMERGGALKRLPACWFESRRRFYAANYGVPYAMALDVVALLSYGLGSLKRTLLRRKDGEVPHLLGDLATHSILWRRNRQLARIQQFVPPSRGG